ncbi:MAG: hypothetical protein AAGF20_01980, partial [Pseudomonadota bacterium]
DDGYLTMAFWRQIILSSLCWPVLLPAGSFLGLGARAHAQALSLDVEALRVANVGATWQTVPLVNTYTQAVVVCTYNLTTNTNNEATIRIRNVGASSFEIRAQRFEDSAAFTPSTAHCVIADEGVNTLGDGRVVEARTVLSTVTAGNSAGWGNTTNVTAQVTGGHGSLVILGQVMSFNDNRASVFWTNNCSNRGTPANLSNICVGKHIGMINGSRANETLGFIITEPGSGTVNDVDYAFARGPNSVAGTRNTPPYQYTVSGDFDTGVATMAAENGGNGGWAVLYGPDPLPNNRLNLAVEEETVAGDTTRRHINEELYYGVFRNRQTPDLTVNKDTSVSPLSAVPYAIPGSDVLYTFTVESGGTAPIDDGSVFLTDTLGSETIFYNADLDGPGPETSAVAFEARNSGLSFDPSTDLGFSSASAKPTAFSQCTYTPSPGYDASVRHICFAPKGRLKAGSLEANTDFTLQYRVRIE